MIQNPSLQELFFFSSSNEVLLFFFLLEAFFFRRPQKGAYLVFLHIYSF